MKRFVLLLALLVIASLPLGSVSHAQDDNTSVINFTEAQVRMTFTNEWSYRIPEFGVIIANTPEGAAENAPAPTGNDFIINATVTNAEELTTFFERPVSNADEANGAIVADLLEQVSPDQLFFRATERDGTPIPFPVVVGESVTGSYIFFDLSTDVGDFVVYIRVFTGSLEAFDNNIPNITAFIDGIRSFTESETPPPAEEGAKPSDAESGSSGTGLSGGQVPSVPVQPLSATYTTADGVTFSYPADWQGAEYDGRYHLSPDPTLVQTPEIAPGNGFMMVLTARTLSGLTAQFGANINNAANYITTFSDTLTRDGTTVLGTSALEVDGIIIYTIEFVAPDYFVSFYAVDVQVGDEMLVAITASYSNDPIILNAYGELSSAIAANVVGQATTVDGSTIPTDALGGGDSTGNNGNTPATTDVVAGGDGVLIWYNAFDLSNESFGELVDAVVLPDGTIMGYANRTFYVFDNTTGQLVEERLSPDFVVFAQIEAAPDGTVWGQGFDGVSRVDANFNVLTTGGSEAELDGAFIVSMSVGADGELYLFDEDFTDDRGLVGYLYIISPSGEFIRTIETGADDGDFSTYDFNDGVFAFGQPDGSILLVGDSLDSRYIDQNGNVLREGVTFGYDQPDDFFNLFFPRDMTIAPDGSLYVLGADRSDGDEVRLYRFAPTGELLGQYRSPEPEAEAPFNRGELPSFGQIEALDATRIVVFGNNDFEYSMIALLDFGQ